LPAATGVYINHGTHAYAVARDILDQLRAPAIGQQLVLGKVNRQLFYIAAVLCMPRNGCGEAAAVFRLAMGAAFYFTAVFGYLYPEWRYVINLPAFKRPAAHAPYVFAAATAAFRTVHDYFVGGYAHGQAVSTVAWLAACLLACANPQSFGAFYIRGRGLAAVAAVLVKLIQCLLQQPL
jgi:hypothetical protein